jgi:hypothetical protein
MEVRSLEPAYTDCGFATRHELLRRRQRRFTPA